MLYQFTKEELTSSKTCSVKDLLLKDKAWWHFFQKHKEGLPQYILDTISRILSCKLHTRGYSKYCCSNPACTHVKHVPFTCKSRFCSSCGKKATEHWVQTQLSVLPACDYQHITFTMPREFWRLFKDNWPLINLLPKVAHGILLEISRKKGLLPGIFTAIHTFGRDLKYNPHLHVSVTKGGLNKEETAFKPIYFKKNIIMRIFRCRMIAFLKKAHRDNSLNLPESLEALCPDYKTFAAWVQRRISKPWIVHVARPTKSPMATISYLGRYLKRPPIAESRLKHYDGNTVTFNFLNHRNNKHQDFHCSTEEFIRRFIQHIPPKNFRLIRYAGFLANRVRGEKLPIVRALMGQEPNPTPYNLKYAELMQKTLGLNPKECILCQSYMVLKSKTIGANDKFFYEQHDNLALRKKIVA